MNGPFIAHETVYECRSCSRLFGSEDLLRLAPSRCNVAYDTLVFVGEALFRRHQTSQEVRAELIARNVRLSTSEIAYLGRKFITFLAAAHHRVTPRIRQAMKLSGGYVLHLDATHEGDAPALMTVMDSLSKIVLANVKLPSEHADHIVPFLKKVQADYGPPRACVHDMGTGICKAVAQVFPDTRDLIQPLFNLARETFRIRKDIGLSRRLMTMLADTPLVKNLDNPAYMEILLDGKEKSCRALRRPWTILDHQRCSRIAVRNRSTAARLPRAYQQPDFAQTGGSII